MSKKIILEFDDETYEKVFNVYLEATKKLTSEKKMTFEEFISELIRSSVLFSNTKFDSSNLVNYFKDLMKNIDPSQMEDMFSSLKGFTDFFNVDENKKEENEDKNKFNDNIEAMKKKS